MNDVGRYHMQQQNSTNHVFRSVVPASNKKPLKTSQNTAPIVTRMTQDVLTHFQAHEISLARFRIGEYMLRESDYRQILKWAKSSNMPPEKVIKMLVDCEWQNHYWNFLEPINFRLKDGAIHSLIWDLDAFLFFPETSEQGLLIRDLVIKGSRQEKSASLRPKLKQLQILCCNQVGLKSIDFKEIPKLQKLACEGNKINELDLSGVPELVELNCSRNHLNTLDFSAVPKLKKLWHKNNQLSSLNLSLLPDLTELRCDGNQLSKLDLSPAKKLTKLYCGSNQLTNLDLSSVPKLTELWCYDNRLAKLNLSSVQKLKKLWCYSNHLAELDLSQVPDLITLACHRNLLRELDLSKVPKLTWLYCDENVKLHNAPPGLNVQQTSVCS